MNIERRDFLKKTGSAVACACIGCTGISKAAEMLMAAKYPENPPGSFRVEGTKLIIDLGKHPSLKETGGWAAFEAGDKKVIVLHPAEPSYKAFENKCTHKAGPVYFMPKDGFMQCDWHGSRFDTNGAVLKGPAEKPLPEFKTALEKDNLTVNLA
jgi:cytochrome b6-f complex iron-sulfur subunit